MQLNPLFVDQLRRLLPRDESDAMIHAIAHEHATTAVRYNAVKRFTAAPAIVERVPWCPSGAYLPERPQFTFDPLLHAGCYYVQDPSSMFIAHIVKSLVVEPASVLDLCAAPGGKTTAALQALPQGSTIVANEIVPQRAQVLRENVIKWGASNCAVTCDSPQTIGEMLANQMDVIVADVPCSGEGMFRKDHEALAQWSPALVEQCAKRQRDILSQVWPALKPGGLLIYSTCTYNTLENEEIVSYIAATLKATPVQVPVEESWRIHPAIDSDYPCCRFLPHCTRGEGLFVSVLRKDDDNLPSSRTIKPSKTKSPATAAVGDMNNWIVGDYSLVDNNGVVNAVPGHILTTGKGNFSKLHIIKHFGTELGVVKGKKTIPSHQLAMSTSLNAHAFAAVDVDYPTAISYLQGQAICIDAPRGHVLIKFNGAPLGFVNNLGNRANNLYPKPWRIMSPHVPAAAPQVAVRCND